MNVLDLIEADGSTGGGKAAPLAALSRAGFDVPAGFVVPASTYSAAAAGLGLTDVSGDYAEARSRILRSRLTDGVVGEVSRSLERITKGSPTIYVAVRSSSVTEDNAHASAAGQHDSFLAVRGIEQVCQAIVSCWASLWTGRAAAYRTRQTGKDTSAVDMAVLIQRFVDANVSGIMFTGATSVIEASWGIGERLASGQVTPDSWRVNGAGIIERRPGLKTERTDRHDGRLVTRPIAPPEQKKPSLTDREILHLHTLGSDVSATLGSPRDIEWAITDDTTWVLQARPITAPVPVSTPASPPRTGNAIITGEPASPGVATGPVRLIRGPSDFPTVKPGDVLVCHHTDPAWTPLFTIASAVVTETGGVLSHAAIVVREVGIPAVLAASRVTHLFAPSSTVTVDGSTGEVTTAEL